MTLSTTNGSRVRFPDCFSATVMYAKSFSLVSQGEGCIISRETSCGSNVLRQDKHSMERKLKGKIFCYSDRKSAEGHNPNIGRVISGKDKTIENHTLELHC